MVLDKPNAFTVDLHPSVLRIMPNLTRECRDCQEVVESFGTFLYNSHFLLDIAFQFPICARYADELDSVEGDRSLKGTVDLQKNNPFRFYCQL